MSRLSAFLHPVVTDETREVVISERFQDKEGKTLPFVIKALTQAENEHIGKLCTNAKGEFDDVAYTQRVIVAATVDPDFSASEMLKTYSPNPQEPLVSPLQVPGRMLLAGEYAKLAKEIMHLSGFDVDLAELAKN